MTEYLNKDLLTNGIDRPVLVDFDYYVNEFHLTDAETGEDLDEFFGDGSLDALDY